jgi:hypothetical protein
MPCGAIVFELTLVVHELLPRNIALVVVFDAHLPGRHGYALHTAYQTPLGVDALAVALATVHVGSCVAEVPEYLQYSVLAQAAPDDLAGVHLREPLLSSALCNP